MRFDLTDAEWGVVEPLLPPHGLGRARVDDRRVLDAIFYLLRTGAPWRDLPGRYGPYTTAYNRFNRWSRRGVWGRVFEALTREMPDSLHAIDSTIVKAHRAAAGAKGGSRNRPSAAHAAVALPKSTRSSTRQAGSGAS
jgi:transposase